MAQATPLNGSEFMRAFIDLNGVIPHGPYSFFDLNWAYYQARGLDFDDKEPSEVFESDSEYKYKSYDESTVTTECMTSFEVDDMSEDDVIAERDGNEVEVDVEGRYHLDLLAIKPQKNRKGEIVVKAPTNPNWRMIVESQRQINFSLFTQTKDGMVEPTVWLFNKWKGTPRSITHLRMDNAGESKKLQAACESAEWTIGIKKYKITPCNTPQQNLLVKVAFNTSEVGTRLC